MQTERADEEKRRLAQEIWIQQAIQETLEAESRAGTIALVALMCAVILFAILASCL